MVVDSLAKHSGDHVRLQIASPRRRGQNALFPAFIEPLDADMRFDCCFVGTLVIVTCLQPAIVDGADAVTPTKTAARPDDARLKPLKDLNGFFPLVVPATKAAWELRRAKLKQRVLVATGLWPMPDRTPLNPVIHGKVSRPPIDEDRNGVKVKRIGFTVERVCFESVPNHFVTGLLFRPDDGKKGVKRPAVLCPHGHGGRLQRHGPEKMLQLIADGEERFLASGQYPKLARCAHLARMGCVTFIFDMLGYADSQQISRELAHGFKRQRPDFEGKESWGLFSAQAEMRLQSIMGIQTWNAVRCLDFLEQLPDVDAARMAVTGGSGGGTQTILLCAIDERPIAAFPNGMVSSSMQGGCTCENCTLLRVGTGNVELAALFAPKPQAMTAANDWTKAMLVNGKGFRELRRVYELMGAKNNVACDDLTHFPHNYNYVSRALMYRWFNKHLRLGLKDPYVEEDFKPLAPEEMSVWDSQHPQPAGGEKYERELTRYLATQSDLQIAALSPTDAKSLKHYQEVVGGAVRTLIGRDLPASQEIVTEKLSETKHEGYLSFQHIVRYQTAGEAVPIASLWPTKTKWNEDVVLWLDGDGKQSLFNANQPRPEVQALLDCGAAVVGADLFMQGRESSELQRVVKNPREAPAYTYCYNHTLFAQRVHDVLSLVAYVRGFKAPGETPKRLHLIGRNGAGPIVAAARALVGSKVDKAVIHGDGFRFADIKSYRDPSFLPGIVKYGDLPALVALNAPHDACLVGEATNEMKVAYASYQATDGRFDARDEEGSIDWLLK